VAKNELGKTCGEVSRWTMRVLVVEDQPEAAASMAMLLRVAGHHVEVASDGPSAVAAARARPPDVILLDIGLPKMDGWQVAKRVQALAGEKRPLLVAITGFAADDDRRRSEEAGIDLHLTKPVDAGQLEWLLKRFRSVIAED
jgi:CheY-like chemotaxis protein